MLQGRIIAEHFSQLSSMTTKGSCEQTSSVSRRLVSRSPVPVRHTRVHHQQLIWRRILLPLWTLWRPGCDLPHDDYRIIPMDVFKGKERN